MMPGSAARAATARPVKNGVSMGETIGMPVCRFVNERELKVLQ